MSGQVLVDNRPVTQSGTLVDPDLPIRLKTRRTRVSRAGQKLQHALDTWSIDLTDQTIADLGAARGGFTEVCLNNNARHIYAIESGFGKLAPDLKKDLRVTDLSKTDIRYLVELPELVDFCVIDLSFVSLGQVFRKCYDLLTPTGQLIALIKPQFEVTDRDKRHGIVLDDQLQQKIVDQTKQLAEAAGFNTREVITSPIRGTRGNQEWLLWAEKVL